MLELTARPNTMSRPEGAADTVVERRNRQRMLSSSALTPS